MEHILNYTINHTYMNDSYNHGDDINDVNDVNDVNDEDITSSFQRMLLITMSLIIMSISCLSACCRHCEESPKQPTTLTETILFTDIMSNETCSICLESFAKNEKISLLSCNHTFHKQCITEWFKKDTSCPICRQNVV